MGIPRVYRNSGENAVASYDYFDIAEGTGVVTYYGGSVDASLAFIMSKNTFYSERVFTVKQSTATSADTKQIDIDFDVTFNLPRVVKGNLMANIPIMIANRETGSSYPYSTYVIMKVRKWDGTTETEIISQTSETISPTIGASSIKTYIFNLDAAVPLTKFKKGETLRVTVEMYGWNTNAGGPQTNYCVGHDPQNRPVDKIMGIALPTVGTDLTFGSDPSTLIIHVPFVIDL